MLYLALSALLHFADVPATYWAYPAITVMASAGVLHGYRDGRFLPGQALSREQAAAILARVEGLRPQVLPKLSDSGAVSSSLRGDVGAAYAAGIIRGSARDVLDPQGKVTRAQAAAMLARAFGIAAQPLPSTAGFRDEARIPAYALGDVVALFKAGIVQGDAAGDFLPAAEVTRAEYSAMLMRAIVFAGGARGLGDVVAGPVQAVYDPNDASLAASSTIGGPAGAIGVRGQTLSLAQGAPVYRSAATADVFAVAPGDPVALWLYPNGQVGFVADLAAAAAAPDTGTVADLSNSRLYLSTGAVVSGSAVRIAYGQLAVEQSSFPSYLLHSEVTVSSSPGGAVAVAVSVPYVYDLSGTITAMSAGGLTVDLAQSSAWSPLIPALSAGDAVVVQITAATTVAAVGTSQPLTPAVGLKVQVIGAYTGGAVQASDLVLSP